MARRFRRRGHRGSMTIPLAPLAGLAAGLITANKNNALQSGNFQGYMNELICNFTGVWPPTGTMYWDRLGQTYTPILAGLLLHKFVGGPPLNLNRALARAKIPLIRL